MTRRMWDGINADAALIRGLWQPGDLVAWYNAGNSYIWTAAERALFPDSAMVSITLTAGADADVLDVERGGATPDQCEAWIARQRAAGYWRPSIYCSLYVVPAVRAGTGRFVLGQDYDLWVADYDGSAAGVYPLAAAKQYRATTGYDLSVVYDGGWPHRVQAPVTPPPPPAPVWPAGVVLREGGTGAAVRVLQQALHDSGTRGERGIAVDGSFGPQTLQAVEEFQMLQRIGVDGIAGPRTRDALIARGLLTAAGMAA